MSCPDCYKGFVLPGEPKGSMVGPDYFTPARGDSTQPTKAIVLLTDIFGLALSNPRIVADHLAEHIGVDVWIPDFFNGKPPLKVEDLEPYSPDRAGVKMKWTGALIFKVLLALPRLIANRPSVVDPRVHAFIKKVRSEKGYERIGAVGYCFGGAMAVRLGSTESVNTIVIAHPASLKPAQVRAIKVPASWLLAEALRIRTRKNPITLSTEFKIWNGKSSFLAHPGSPHPVRPCAGTAHGFAVRPNLQVPEVKAGYEGGLEQTIAWFKKTL
ncbi:dienelactone hydrolase endo-1-3,1,4-beta-D-glucanase [Lactarius akahatsu]|uniref:Dienelactone hydrolase endo-1-3,1,4-beta-D-glucanase n=1 Tax=Lactarius akahatsu TaxID=416441 RepID=A0AAD4QH08_9AGAM|nr:dienelactone hydrolase endo-1-3,1,4-beta-D-glucanase [Lactarius akahatsu]